MKSYTLQNQVFAYLLQKRASTTHALVSEFETRGYTKQGVYKVLRNLKKEGKVLWTRTRVEVHLMWLHQEIDMLASALPRKEIVFQEFTQKKMTYKAKTLVELEHIYGQIFISLISSTAEQVRNFLFYDVHNYTYVNAVPIVDWYIDFIS